MSFGITLGEIGSPEPGRMLEIASLLGVIQGMSDEKLIKRNKEMIYPIRQHLCPQ